MSHDTITLRLQGDVPIVEFADAMQHLSKLLTSLAEEIVGDAAIEWEIATLQAGSATITLRGFCQEPSYVMRIVEGYIGVGEALERNAPIPYSDDVIKHAEALTAYINGKVKGVEFAANDRLATIAAPRSAVEHTKQLKRHSLGIVSGVIETISGRGQPTCTIYDSLFDLAIKCYIDASHKEIVRSAWEKRVAITGDIERDPDTGRPTAVRNVRRIDVEEKGPQGIHKRSRGVLPWDPGDEPPEIKIRRMRNAD